MTGQNQNYYHARFLWLKMLVFGHWRKNVSIMGNYINPCPIAYGRDPAFIQVLKPLNISCATIADIHYDQILAMGECLKQAIFRFCLWLYWSHCRFFYCWLVSISSTFLPPNRAIGPKKFGCVNSWGIKVILVAQSTEPCFSDYLLCLVLLLALGLCCLP